MSVSRAALKQQGVIWMFVSDNKASDKRWRSAEVEIIGQVYSGGGFRSIC